MKLETAQDKQKENFVVRRLATDTPEVSWIPLPGFSSIDYIGVRDGVVLCAIEIKTRKETQAKIRSYPGGLLLKRRKFDELIQIEKLLSVPAFAVFAFSNGTGHVMAARPSEIGQKEDVLTGRRDRDLACDLEPVVLLDWNKDLVHWLPPLAEDL